MFVINVDCVGKLTKKYLVVSKSHFRKLNKGNAIFRKKDIANECTSSLTTDN